MVMALLLPTLITWDWLMCSCVGVGVCGCVVLFQLVYCSFHCVDVWFYFIFDKILIFSFPSFQLAWIKLLVFEECEERERE